VRYILREVAPIIKPRRRHLRLATRAVIWMYFNGVFGSANSRQQPWPRVLIRDEFELTIQDSGVPMVRLRLAMSWWHSRV